MEVLRFVADQPVEVALKFDEGKAVEGRFGDQVLYTLVSEEVMYLDPPVAKRIKDLRIGKGELFSICKRSTTKGSKRSVEWEIKRVDPAPAPTPAAEAAPAKLVSINGNGTAIEPETAKALYYTALATSATKAAIATVAEGEKFAASIGFACHFEHEDVRALSISIFIAMTEQKGGHR